MIRIELRSDGPHSDDYTAEVVGATAEAVRVLNHATGSNTGLTYPQTVYTIAGGLAGLAKGIPQTLRQVIEFLDHEALAGRIGSDDGSDPLLAVERARLCAEDAQLAAYALGTALADMQTAVSGLHVREGDQP